MADPRVLFALFFCSLLALAGANHFNRNNGSPGHLLLAPSSFLIGVSNKICISRFGSATIGSATAHIELQSPPSNRSEKTNIRHIHKSIARARKLFSDGNGDCLELYVPKTVHRKAILHFKMRFETLPNYKINTKKEVKILHDSNILIIQTDKPLYRGGEVVKLRVMQLKTDLTPQYSPIYRVYIEAPTDIFGAPVKIAQWFNVTSQMGYMQREYQLDKYARKGDWRIVVDSRDPTVAPTAKTFHVTDYKLPNFYISVGFQENVVRSFKQIHWTICARYMYDEVAEGKLHINVKSDSYGYPSVYYFTELWENNRCYNHTIRTKLLGFQEKDENKPTRVIADVAFQERNTKIWKNTTAITHIQENVVKIDFVQNYNTHFKPGLPQKFKVKVTNWDGLGVYNAEVKLCKTSNETLNDIDLISRNASDSQNLEKILDKCDSAKSNKEGFASFVYSIPNNVDHIYLKAIVVDHLLENFETQTKENGFASASIKLYSWGNKTKINMAIGSPMSNSQELNNGEKYAFPVFLKFNNDNIIKQLTLHYLIVTRFGTIHSWGISTQCVSPIHDAQNMETVFGPPILKNDCFENNYSETGVYKMMLNIQITNLMCPYSHLIAYFVQPNGELIVASKKFETNECLPNKLTQEWIPKTVRPFDTVKLHINSVGPALCMFGVKNVAFNLVAPKSSVFDDINEKVAYFMEFRYNQTMTDILKNICFIDQSPKKYDEVLRTYFWNTLKTFLESGLEVLTDVLPPVEKCLINTDNDNEKPAEISYLIPHKSLKDRVYFPETWLWDIKVMNLSGVLDIETTVPDDITKWESEVFCLTRSGVAASKPGENNILQVFQPFFIELTAPNVIKRGEHVQMFYKIYNYLDQKLPVVFDIEVFPTAAASITSHEGAVNRVSCVSEKKSLINHFTIKAHQLRSINITITAHVKNNMQKICSNYDIVSIPHDIKDRLIKQIAVEPEGMPVENHKSALLCIDGNNEYSNKTEVSWVFNRTDCVDQSENWFISLVGDITGPMSMNIDKLVSVPMGCGEQNMVLLSYNIIALEYSILKKRTSGEMKDRAIDNLLTGYQRQLSYLHTDTGAFSAFGNQDEYGSTWLTAFCIKYLSILKRTWNIGSNSILNKTSAWLLSKQMENGCFSNEGQIFHREMKGGLESEKSNVALTAFVITSILDGNIPNIKPINIQDASYCLAALKYDDLLSDDPNQYNNSANMYTFALVTLAQIKIEQYLNKNKIDTKQFINQDVSLNNVTIESKYKFFAGGASEAVSLLKKNANINGEFVWWEASSLRTSIETTGYAILSLLALGGQENVMFAISAAKWLSLHRNTNGGFKSTQDTLIAIEALCALRHAMPDIPPSMNVIVEGPGRGRHFTVSPSEKHKLHVVMMKAMDTSDEPTKLKIKAQGKGCLLVQATQRYNQHFQNNQPKSSFDLFVKASTDGTFNCKSNNTWCMCAAVLEVCVSWNDPAGSDFPEMAILEVQLPTGYSPDRYLLYNLIKRENILLRRIEESKNEDYLYMYLAAPLKSTSFRPNECFRIFLMGPKSRTTPVTVKVYDYYHTESMKSKTFTIPEDCPFEWHRTPHEEPADIQNNFDVTKQTDQNWHVIDSETDLEVPKTMEGVQPIYELPPKDFIENLPFENWTLIDSDLDLDFPTGEEANEEVWDIL